MCIYCLFQNSITFIHLFICLYTFGKSSNRSPEIFSILAKLSSIQKIPQFGRKILYIRNEYSNYHFDRSLVSASKARKRWVPLFCQITPNHTIHFT